MEYTITKFKGLGGYEILGKCRRGGPVVSEADNKKEIEKEKDIDERKRLVPEKMTKEQIERELAKPLFKDSTSEFENKMQAYLNKYRLISQQK